MSGSARVVINNADLMAGINPQRLTDTTVLFKGFDDMAHELNLTNGEVRSLGGPANIYAAGGGRWQATGGNKIWVATSQQGEFAWIEEFGSNNNRTVFLEGVALMEHQPVNWCRVEEGHIVWSRGTEVWGKRPGQPIERLHFGANVEFLGVPIPTPDGMWVLCMTNTDLRLAPWGSTEGHIIATGEDRNMWPDAACVGREIVVVCNTNQGQWPAEQPYRISLDAPKQSLVTVPTPQPIPTGGKMIRSFERPFWMAPFFSHSNRYGDTTDHVGNAIWIPCEEMGRAIAFGMPLVVAVDTSQAYDLEALNLTVVWYVSAGDATELQHKVEMALSLPERPIVAYLDLGTASAWPEQRPAWITDRVWPSVMAYRDAGEPLASFSQRVTAMLDRVKSYGTVGMTLTPAFYTRNGQTSVEHITECMGLYEQWIRDYPIVCFMPFADRRPTGMLQHPEFREFAKAFEYAIPSSRPNRFDYWRSKEDALTVLRNKLGQSRSAVVLEPDLRKLILSKFEEQPEPIEPEPQPEPGDLENQLALVARTRDEVFPELVGKPMHDAEKAALWTKHVAWRLRHLGVGLAKAKPGSANHGGACPEAPDGITTDVVALKDGTHWDIQIDGHTGEAWPRWAKEENPNNHPAIAARWIPAIKV